MTAEYSPDFAAFKPNNGAHRMKIPVAAIMSLAIGADDPYNILTAYGFSDAMIEAIVNDPAVQRAVDAKRSELKRDGLVFKAKAAYAAEVLLEEIVREVLVANVPLTVKHDVFKSLMKAGDLEPKQDKTAVAPTGFSVNITIGNKTLSLGGEKPDLVVDVEAKTAPNTGENGVETAHSGGENEVLELPEPPGFIARMTPKIPVLTPIFEEKS